MPEAEPLKKIRNHLALHAPEFYGIMNDPSFKKHFSEMYDHKLKTAPKGFPKDHEFIELLRYKSFVFSRTFTDKEITGDKFVENTVDAFEQLYKVNAFLLEAL